MQRLETVAQTEERCPYNWQSNIIVAKHELTSDINEAKVYGLIRRTRVKQEKLFGKMRSIEDANEND